MHSMECSIFSFFQIPLILLSMNEVSIDLVISKKKNINFLDELGLFIGEKPIFTKKNSVALPSAVAVCRAFMAVHMKILYARFLKDAFKLETSPFGSLKELV
jgi:hypothetical protein